MATFKIYKLDELVGTYEAESASDAVEQMARAMGAKTDDDVTALAVGLYIWCEPDIANCRRGE